MRTFLNILSAILLFASFNGVKAQRSLSQSAYKAGDLIIQLEQGYSMEDYLKALSQQFPKTNTVKHERLSMNWNIWLLQFSGEYQADLAMEFFNSKKGTSVVQRNHIVTMRGEPNDSLFTSMWNLNNTGQTSGTPGADVDAIRAWDISTGGFTILGDTIVAAVVDGGFDLDHEDLDFWKNYNEIPGDTIDNDSNGYVDDYYGWDPYDDDGQLPGDDHGTHVSGILGAIGNNEIGIAGVNWTIKILGVAGSVAKASDEAIVIKAYNYLYTMRKLYNETDGEKGAFIVSANSSFGVDRGDPADTPIWCSLYDSLGSVGILSVGAGPNINHNVDTAGDVPSNCSSEFLIAVTNTNQYDNRHPGAGFAAGIDIGAPGYKVLSTVTNDKYDDSFWIGTSMAAPHVTGAIALMYSAACGTMIEDYKNYPDSIALVVKDYILKSVDTLPDLVGKIVTGGRLNLYNSLMALEQYPCDPDDTGTLSLEGFYLNVFPNPTEGILQIAYATKGENTSRLQLLDITGRLVQDFGVLRASTQTRVKRFTLSELSAGYYFVRLSGNNNVVTKKVLIGN